MIPPPFGYLDPGSGSLLVQVLLGGSAAVAVLLRLGWRYARALFSPRNREEG
jgi:hypothetical protein